MVTTTRHTRVRRPLHVGVALAGLAAIEDGGYNQLRVHARESRPQRAASAALGASALVPSPCMQKTARATNGTIAPARCNQAVISSRSHKQAAASRTLICSPASSAVTHWRCVSWVEVSRFEVGQLGTRGQIHVIVKLYSIAISPVNEKREKTFRR